MKARFGMLCAVLMFLSMTRLYPQTGRSGDADTPFLIPQTVFVGDRARLVVPLGLAFSGSQGIVLDNPGELPENQRIAIRRLEIERRGDSYRLLVDFDAYAVGRVELPVLVLGPHEFTGLEVSISSILESEGNGRMLSPAASGLAVPGTVLFIYGLIAGLIVLIILILIFFIVLIPRLPSISIRRRRRFIKNFKKSISIYEEQLRTELAASRECFAGILAAISLSLRELVNCFIDRDCRAFVPSEFLSLCADNVTDNNYAGGNPAAKMDGSAEASGAEGAAENDAGTSYIHGMRIFLSSFFARSDDLRFGSLAAGSAGNLDKIRDDVLGILKECGNFADGLEAGGQDDVMGNKKGIPVPAEERT